MQRIFNIVLSIMRQDSDCCRRPDFRSFDNLSSCLSCGHILKSPVGSCQEVKSIVKASIPKLQSEAVISPYAYSPVRDDQFRLVEIQPGQFDDTLVCQIFHGCIGNEKYEAISYTWADGSGEQDQSQDIVVCSSLALGARTVKATRNCENALRRVRSSTDTRIIWIDALCINQSNPAERGHQVHKMPQIYANATKVIVYLGEAAGASDQLLNAINELRFGAALGSDLQTHIQEFLGRRWFGRVWCLQEVAMANYVEMICGARTLPFERLVLANLDKCAFKSGERLPLILRLPMQEKHSLENLYDLLENARISCAASDPRDMVYALLGLFHGNAKFMLQPDYEISVAEVYNKTTEFLMNYHKSLNFLTQAQRRTTGSAPMASWAIDWTAKDEEMQNVIDTSSMLEGNSDVTQPNGHFSFSSIGSSRVLTATAKIHSIVMAAAPLRVSDDSRGFIDICGEISRPSARDGCQQASVSALTHEAQFEIATITRILTGKKPPLSYSRSRLRTNELEHKLSDMRCFDESWSRHWNPAKFTDFDGEFWKWIFWQLVGCRFWKSFAWKRPVKQSAIFILDNLTIGVGPCELAHGDKLVQLANSSAWYFMRPNNGQYELVGECCALTHDILSADIVASLRSFNAVKRKRLLVTRRGLIRELQSCRDLFRSPHRYQATTGLGAYYQLRGPWAVFNSDWDSWIAFWECNWALQVAQSLELEEECSPDVLENYQAVQDGEREFGPVEPSSVVSQVFSIPNSSIESFIRQAWESIDIW